MRVFDFYLSAIVLFALPLNAYANPKDLGFTTQSGDDISISQDSANGNLLYIWLPSEAGPQASEASSAAQLARNGIEVWRVDLVADYFLPLAASSMERIPAETVNELIQHAITTTHKSVYLVSTGRGAIPLLRGAHLWQQQHAGQTGLAGAIFMSPKFFVETPEPGMPAALMPVVSATNLPIFILQPEQSPWFWKLDETTTALESGGSDVYIRRLAGGRDRFNFRPDANAAENQLSASLPRLLLQASQLLAPYRGKARSAVAQQQAAPEVQTEKKDRRLEAYKGNPQAPKLRLSQLNGEPLDLKDLKGQVVLVNFWASWCPPCVHEMPSMQRLHDQLIDQNFEILGVNMAEDRDTIQTFLDTKVNVDFPIIMDSKGAALKRWGVFAFPTSYLVDKHGVIRYALFGSVEWDTPEILFTITSLINEP